jgi:hypothetical protein
MTLEAEKDQEIEALTYELCVKMQAITELKEQIALLKPCGHTGFESIMCQVCGYPNPRKLIAKLRKERDLWKDAYRVCEKDNDELREENHKLDADGIMINKQRDALEAKLSRLTALIESDEEAEKVAEDYTPSDYIMCAFPLQKARHRGLNDYRTMLRKEAKK